MIVVPFDLSAYKHADKHGEERHNPNLPEDRDLSILGSGPKLLRVFRTLSKQPVDLVHPVR